MPTWVSGKYGYGLKFNGNNTYALTQNAINFSTNTTGYTFSAWIKPEYTSTHTQSLIVGYYPYIALTAYERSSSSYGVSGWLGSTYHSQGSYAYGIWHHVTVVYHANSSIREVYVDGAWIGNDTSSGPTLDWDTAPVQLLIGTLPLISVTTKAIQVIPQHSTALLTKS